MAQGSKSRLQRLTEASKAVQRAAESLHGRHIIQDGDMGHMAMYFTWSQMERMYSLLLLVEHNLHRDAGVIARTMFEGLAILLWSNRDVPNRAMEWRQFLAVEQYYLLSDMHRLGRTMDTTSEQWIMDTIKTVGPKFYTEKAKKMLANKQTLPPIPYIPHWPPIRLPDLMAEVSSAEVYKRGYQRLSMWAHWSTLTLARPSQNSAEGELNFQIEEEDTAEMSLVTGGNALLQTLEVLDEHSDIGMTDRLSELRTHFESAVTDGK